MTFVLQFFIWLFFWPLILLFWLVIWMTEVVGVPWEVLGIIYAVLAMGFFGLLQRLEYRDSGEKPSRSLRRSWLAATLCTAVSVFALVWLCGWFSCYGDGIGQICGMFALLLPVLVGCLWFVMLFLSEWETAKSIRIMTAVCCLTAVLIPLLLGGGGHFAGLEELDALRENAVVYEGVVTDRAMSECGAYIGLEFADGGGNCFYEVYGAPFPDGIAVGDRVRIAAWDGKAVSVEEIE